MAERVLVGVNGYGVIGKRVADAVRVQPDMEIVGVSDVTADYRIRTADVLALPIYASLSEALADMKGAGVPVRGTLDDLLGRIDVVVDCTPKGIGAKNLARYRAAGVKAILQGGEKHEVTGHSFVAQVNYASAVGRDATRVVSCNTTATVRTLGALDQAGLLGKARGVLIRRATDPWEADHSGGRCNPGAGGPRHRRCSIDRADRPSPWHAARLSARGPHRGRERRCLSSSTLGLARLMPIGAWRRRRGRRTQAWPM
jgi:glyceraldehyde-3-phosphate dehydrogenase (NAD(P))